MSEIPDKIARSQELIEQRKRQLAENIKRVRTPQKNEEFKKQERQKEIEKQKKEIERIKSEKGIQSKPKKEESERRISEVASTEEPNPSSVYISDFESDSGSEIAEKHVFSAHTKNPQAIHFDSPVLTRNNRVEIASISKQSDNKTTTDPKSSAEAKTKTSAIEIENSTGKFKGFVKENSLENESEGIDSCNTDKFIHYDDLPVK